MSMHTLLDRTISAFRNARVLVSVMDTQLAHSSFGLKVVVELLVDILSPSIRVEGQDPLPHLCVNPSLEFQVSIESFVLLAQEIKNHKAHQIVNERYPVVLPSFRSHQRPPPFPINPN